MKIYKVAIIYPNLPTSKSNLVTLTEAIRIINSWKSMGYENVKLIDTTIKEK